MAYKIPMDKAIERAAIERAATAECLGDRNLKQETASNRANPDYLIMELAKSTSQDMESVRKRLYEIEVFLEPFKRMLEQRLYDTVSDRLGMGPNKKGYAAACEIPALEHFARNYDR